VHVKVVARDITDWSFLTLRGRDPFVSVIVPLNNSRNDHILLTHVEVRVYWP
jgi:hypothetical protein